MTSRAAVGSTPTPIFVELDGVPRRVLERAGFIDGVTWGLNRGEEMLLLAAPERTNMDRVLSNQKTRVTVVAVSEIDRLRNLEKSVEGLRDCAHQEHFSTRLNHEESRHLLNAFSYLNDRHDRGEPTQARRDKLGCPVIETKPRPSPSKPKGARP